MSRCNCVIEDILKTPFSSRNFDEKKIILDRGRPTPLLKIITVTQRCTRHFSKQLYETFSWLTGCNETLKLYCWPCLLFSNEKSVWNSTGFSDMNNLSKAGKRHGKGSRSHLRSMISLKTFGHNRIENLIDSTRSVFIQNFNEKVKKNREILKYFIDVTCFLACQELAFRGDIENSDSLNRGNYIELIHLLAAYNPVLENHLDTSTVFSGLSSDIQNDIISSIAYVLKEEIRVEFENADYVGLLLDETTDVSNKSQLSIIFRYVKKDGFVVERFFSFVDVSLGRSAQDLFEFIVPFLKEEKIVDKLVSQSYDGAAVMSGNCNGLQKKLREVIPSAHYIHCFAHKLNLVLSQSVSKIKECAGFFKSLQSFVGFFSHSSKRLAALNKIVQKKIPTSSPTRWEYNGRLVRTIFDLKNYLVIFFEEIIENESDWDNEAILQSKGLLYNLNDKRFIILLYFFNKFLPQTDILFKILQNKTSDVQFCVTSINNFKKSIERISINLEEFWDDVNQKENLENFKIRRTDSRISNKQYYVSLLNIIIKQILSELEHRFSTLPNFQFLEFSDTKKYTEFASTFPDYLLINLQNSYPSFFDLAALKTELQVVFIDENFKSKKNIQEVVIFLIETELCNCFTEFFKLSKLMLTFPVTTASVERSFSCLKRIKSFLRNRCSQSRLSNLAIISIEKQMVQELKSKNNFYNKVIEHYATKERRIDLIYKN